MRWALVIGVLWAACGTAVASSERAEWNPPARFDHPYPGKLVETYLPQPQVFSECQKVFKTYNIKADGFTGRGCAAIIAPNVCKIIIVDQPYRGSTPEAIRRHEIGHCNDWPANHPD